MSPVLDMSAVGNYPFNASTTLVGDVNTTNDAMQSTTRNKVVLSAGTGAASPPSYCVTPGSPVLSATGHTGFSGLQWQQSTASGTGFTNIPNSTTIPFNIAAAITQTMYYRLVATCGANSVNSSESIVTLLSPTVLSVTPATRCGDGTVTLGATGSAGTTLNWYDLATGGMPVGTGPSFTTPVITATTNYYVAAATGGGVENIPSPTVGTSSFWTATAGWGLRITVNTQTTINSVKMYPLQSTSPGAATLQIKITDITDAVLHKGPVYNFTAATTATEHTVPVNLNVPPGNYKMVMTSTGINGLIRESTGVTFPYNSPSNSVSVTAGDNGAGTASTPSAYYWFYAWSVSAGCESPRTTVAVTVDYTVPVTLLNFKGTKDGNKNMLDWSTSTEIITMALSWNEVLMA